MSSEPDLRRAIGMKPMPFPLRNYFERPEQSTSPHIHHHHHHHQGSMDTCLSPYTIFDAETARHDGSSTAIDITQTCDSRDPTARHIPFPASHSDDIERQWPAGYTADNDPYRLSQGLKDQAEMALIRANTSRKRDGCGPIVLNRKAHRAKKVEQFYETQNENIERLLKSVDEHRRDAKDEDKANHVKYRIAVIGSFAANITLAILQLYAASTSKSLSLFTTMADALFDPMSNITLILCNRAVARVDGRRFPSGKARIETAGNLTFCALMNTVSVVIMVQSIQSIATHETGDTNQFHLPSVVAVGVAFATKFALFLYCWTLRNKYGQIRILWEDHRNDLFINGFGILTSVGGSKLKWWLDPAGAMVLSVLIIFLWSRTAYSEFQLLIGVTADPAVLQHITYIAMTHSPAIRQIDTVRAYHSGPRLIVEVDVVMDPEETLRATHDVAEELQIKLESLPDVERAYVHVDYETDHQPEHFLKKEL